MKKIILLVLIAVIMPLSSCCNVQGSSSSSCCDFEVSSPYHLYEVCLPTKATIYFYAVLYQYSSRSKRTVIFYNDLGKEVIRINDPVYIKEASRSNVPSTQWRKYKIVLNTKKTIYIHAMFYQYSLTSKRTLIFFNTRFDEIIRINDPIYIEQIP